MPALLLNPLFLAAAAAAAWYWSTQRDDEPQALPPNTGPKIPELPSIQAVGAPVTQQLIPTTAAPAVTFAEMRPLQVGPQLQTLDIVGLETPAHQSEQPEKPQNFGVIYTLDSPPKPSVYWATGWAEGKDPNVTTAWRVRRADNPQVVARMGLASNAYEAAVTAALQATLERGW